MTAFFRPLAVSPCADCAKIAAGIPKAINAQNTSLSLICRCRLGQSGHQVFCPLDATPRQGQREHRRLFDQLVGANEQGQRQLDSERLGSLRVDKQFNLAGLFNG